MVFGLAKKKLQNVYLYIELATWVFGTCTVLMYLLNLSFGNLGFTRATLIPNDKWGNTSCCKYSNIYYLMKMRC